MPKRPNPFGDSAPLQFKTHVGLKEIDSGVMQDELMKGVYEKTRQMLFTGAHRQIDVNDNHMAEPLEQPFTLADTRPSADLDPSQARLDTSCHLIIPAHDPTCSAQNGSSPSGSNTHASIDCDEPDGAVPQAGFFRTEPLLVAPGQLCLDSHGQLIAAMDCDSNASSSCSPCPESSASEKKSSQMQGGLARFGFKSSKQASPSAENVAVCLTCRRLLAKVHIKCHFCEKGVCMECVRQCDTCNYTFCQVCTMLNYDEAMEKAFCLTCMGY